jgi:hypothetical protein
VLQQFLPECAIRSGAREIRIGYRCKRHLSHQTIRKQRPNLVAPAAYGVSVVAFLPAAARRSPGRHP